MTGRYLVTQRYRHPELGVIHIVVRANATRFTARWKNDELAVTVPQHTTAAQFEDALAQMMPRLKERRPEHRNFPIGWTYDTPLHHIRTERGRYAGYKRDLDNENSTIIITASFNTPDEGDEMFTRFVNDSLDRYALIFAPELLIPEMNDLARQLGLHPRSVGISRGVRVLGKCYPDGRIELSRNLIFYPGEHRRYVYAHELAHLTHMNHGPQFHALLDKYLEGRERELKKASDAFKTPFIR